MRLLNQAEPLLSVFIYVPYHPSLMENIVWFICHFRILQILLKSIFEDSLQCKEVIYNGN